MQRPIKAALQGSPLLIAHRGGSALAPENTMAAFRQAVELWNADMIELDVHASSDGRGMVIHDPTIDRTTNGKGAVAEQSCAALQSFDAGYHFTSDGGRSFPFRGRGVRIPTIEEVLQSFPNTRFTVELKTAAAQRPLAEAIEAAAATERVIVAGERRVFSNTFRRYPGALSASREDALPFYLLHRFHLSFFGRLRADVVQMPEYLRRQRALSPRLIRDLHRQGVLVHAWTINRVEDMERLLDWGIDGIVTDRPDLLAELLNKRMGRPLPRGLSD